MITKLRVPAIATGEVVPAGCCPVPAAAAAVQILMFLEGVQDVEVDEAAGTLRVTHEPGVHDFAGELAAAGLAAQLGQDVAQEAL